MSQQNDDYSRGRKDADLATLLCIPETYRVNPTNSQRVAVAVAVGASIQALVSKIRELEDQHSRTVLGDRIRELEVYEKK